MRDEPQLKTMIDLGLVGENIMDIADFAMEKYEFTSGVTLSDSDREKALEQVREELWEMVKQARKWQQAWAKKLFAKADEVVRNVQVR